MLINTYLWQIRENMKRKFVKLFSAMALMVLLIAGCDGVSSSSDVSSSHISSETSSSLV